MGVVCHMRVAGVLARVDFWGVMFSGQVPGARSASLYQGSRLHQSVRLEYGAVNVRIYCCHPSGNSFDFDPLL